MESKSIFKSKTFWVNVIAGVIATATLISPEYLAQLGIAEDKQVAVLTSVGTVTAILNVILRAITSAPVTITQK